MWGLNSISCEGVPLVIVFIIRFVYVAWPQTSVTLNTLYIFLCQQNWGVQSSTNQNS